MADKVVAPLAVSVDKKSSSSPLPASSSSMDKKHPAPLLAVIVDVKPSPSPASSMDKQVKKKKKPPVVLLVCLWALLNAAIFAGFSIATIIKNRTPCTKSTWWWRCVELTDAAAAKASALVRGQLWCSAPQAAAAAALALLLLTRRGRRSGWAIALAVVALAATAASHSMERRVAGIFLAAVPGDAGIIAEAVLAFVVSVLDLVGFLCLLLVGDGGDEE